MVDLADIRYEVAIQEESRVQVVLSCLQNQLYNVFMYVLNEDGVPLAQPASLPLSSNINRNSDTIPCKQLYPGNIATASRLGNVHCQNLIVFVCRKN